MALSDQVEAALAAGAARMMEAMGQTVSLYDPRTQETHTVTAHFAALSEEAMLQEGGFGIEHRGDCWWARSEDVEPEVGWLVKISGRTLRIREVIDDPLDSEWSVNLEAVVG